MNLNAIGAADKIQSAIAAASRRTGVDFSYLLGQAAIESGLRADAKAATSSATGLYQFIDQSWLGVVKAHGAEHGLGWAASAIKQNGDGSYSVDDAATRKAILDLRKDPTVASLMAASHAADNKSALEQALGRDATGTDLYMAHFLGLGGARNFLSAMQSNPQRSGAAMFPAAARSNRSIFYDGNGQPRSLQDIYARFSAKLDNSVSGALSGSGGGNPYGDLPGQLEVLVGNGALGNDQAWVQTTLANLNVLGSGSPLSSGSGDDDTTGLAALTGKLGGASGGAGGLGALASQLGGQFGGQAGGPLGGVSALLNGGLAQSLSPQALASLYRPTPDSARLAYMMLANLGA